MAEIVPKYKSSAFQKSTSVKSKSQVSLSSTTTGTSLLFSGKLRDKKFFQGVSYISDELLNDIPEIPDDSRLKALTDGGDPVNRISLFQGFKANINRVDEEIYIFKELNLDALKLKPNTSLITNNHQINTDDEVYKRLKNPLPLNITTKKIRNSSSNHELETFKIQIVSKMANLQVSKKLLTDEIDEIDSKIKVLQNARLKFFEKISKIEKDEVYLDSCVDQINNRIAAVEKSNIGIANSPDNLLMSLDDYALIDSSDLVNTNDKENRSTETNVANDQTNQKHTISKISNDENINSNNDYTNADDEDEANEFMTKSMYHSIKTKKNFKTPALHSRTSSLSNNNNNGTSLTRSSSSSSFIKRRSRKHQSQLSASSLHSNFPTRSQICSFPTTNSTSQGILCFDFDHPFGNLVTSSDDMTVKVWDLTCTTATSFKNSPKCTHILHGHVGNVGCMQMDENILVTGSSDTMIKLWDLSRLTLNEYNDISEGKHGEEYDTNDYEDIADPCVATYDAHVGSVTALCLDSPNNALVTGSQDCTVRQWDLLRASCLQTLDLLSILEESNGLINTTNKNSSTTYVGGLQCFSAALATGTCDGIVRLWDLRSGSVIRALSGHTGAITSLQFDDTVLMTGSEDGTVKIWDLRTGAIQSTVRFTNASPNSQTYKRKRGVTSLQFDTSYIAGTVAGLEIVKVYDRTIGDFSNDLVSDKEREAGAECVYTRYKNGYAVTGFSDGIVSTWAV